MSFSIVLLNMIIILIMFSGTETSQSSSSVPTIQNSKSCMKRKKNIEKKLKEKVNTLESNFETTNGE